MLKNKKENIYLFINKKFLYISLLINKYIYIYSYKIIFQELYEVSNSNFWKLFGVNIH